MKKPLGIYQKPVVITEATEWLFIGGIIDTMNWDRKVLKIVLGVLI